MKSIWHEIDLAWNRSGFFSSALSQGASAKPFRLLKFAPYSSENQFKLPIVL
jgi:hypothetical protein